MPKKHPADIYAEQQIARATAFMAYYMAGQGRYTRVECSSAEDAIREADRLTKEIGRFGRQACAYAITPEGASFPLGTPYQTQAMRRASLSDRSREAARRS